MLALMEPFAKRGGMPRKLPRLALLRIFIHPSFSRSMPVRPKTKREESNNVAGSAANSNNVSAGHWATCPDLDARRVLPSVDIPARCLSMSRKASALCDGDLFLCPNRASRSAPHAGFPWLVR